MTYSHPALAPLKLNSLSLPNRTVVAPMSRISTEGDGVPTTRMERYYRTYAKGGFALIITEGTYTDRAYAQAYPNQPGITAPLQKEGWRNIVNAVHGEGGKIFMQLMHAGALSQHLSNTRAPSAIQPLRGMLPGYSRKQGMYPLPSAMNLKEIDEAIQGFVDSARNAQEVGFDGVEVHAANGYLLDQFLTEYTNSREDKYGRTVANRIRLTADVIRSIKENTSSDFTVGVRLSQGKVNDFDYLWSGGLNDGEIIFGAVKNAGADYIHFASEGKGFDHGSLTRTGESLPRLARELTGLLVIANGGLDDIEQARRILDGSHADLISLGKGALVNPDWPNKLKSGTNPILFDSSFFANGVAL